MNFTGDGELFYQNSDGEWIKLGDVSLRNTEFDIDIPNDVVPITKTRSFSGKITSDEEALEEFGEMMRLNWLAHRFPFFVWN